METTVIGFSENNLRMLRLNSEKKIVYASETSLGFNLSDGSAINSNMEEYINLFADKANEMKVFDGDEILSAGVVIDSSQTFLNILPIDFNEDISNINSHLLWELSNYYPGSYKNYNIKFYRLHNNYISKNIDEVLLIAIDKSRIKFINLLCASIGFKIKNVEIDQFAAEKFIKEFYTQEAENKTALIIGFKNSRIDFSLIEKGKIKYYDYSKSDKAGYLNAFKKQINSFRYSAGFRFPERVFIYGEDDLSEFVNILEHEFGKNKVTDLVCSGMKLDVARQSSFAPLFGLALRNLT